MMSGARATGEPGRLAPAALQWRSDPVKSASAGFPLIDVAASIVRAPDRRVLLAERPARLMSGGFWELPGGKLEAGETARDAAVRELEEEAGIHAVELRPWISYEHAFPTKRVRLHFFVVNRWQGKPQGREGQRLAWVDPAEPSVSPILPSNIRVLLGLGLPSVCAVFRARNAEDRKIFLSKLPTALAQGLRLIQVHAPEIAPAQRIAFAHRVNVLAQAFGAHFFFTGSALEARRARLAGIHSTAEELRRLPARPPAQLWSASCRNASDLARAAALGADFAVMSPVLQTSAHPEEPLGWDGLKRLAERAPMPVYAQGGMTPRHAPAARDAGAAGVAVNFVNFLPPGGENAE